MKVCLHPFIHLIAHPSLGLFVSMSTYRSTFSCINVLCLCCVSYTYRLVTLISVLQLS
jgi:hypothetical protein